MTPKCKIKVTKTGKDVFYGFLIGIIVLGSSFVIGKLLNVLGVEFGKNSDGWFDTMMFDMGSMLFAMVCILLFFVNMIIIIEASKIIFTVECKE